MSDGYGPPARRTLGFLLGCGVVCLACWAGLLVPLAVFMGWLP